MKILSDAEKMLESLPKADIERYTELVKDDYSGYIFYKRERNGDKLCSCSACGKTFNANYKKRRSYTADDVEFYNAKHNDIVICPKCGKKATMKCKGRIRCYDSLYEKGCYAFFEAVSTDEVIIRCYNVSNRFYEDLRKVSCALEFNLDSVYILQPGEAYRIVKGWYCAYYYNDSLNEPFLHGWSYGQSYSPYTIIWFDKLEDTFLKYSQFWKYFEFYKRSYYSDYYSQGKHDVSLIRYLCMYALYPSIEFFMKLGFKYAVKLLVQNRQPNKRLFNWEADNPVDALRCKNKQEFNEIKEFAGDGEHNFVENLKIAKRIRKLDSTITLKEAEAYCHIDISHIKVLEKMMALSGKSLRQCENYLIKQAGEGHYQRELLTNFDIGIWKDYIEAAEKLEYDLSVETVVLPRNLRAAHDTATAAVEYKENRKKLEFMKNLDVNRRKKYEYTDGELMIRLPHSMQEIIDEGKALSHCVGGYADRHADGKTTILFIRRCSEPNVPYYTLEIIGNKIMQYHGYANERDTRGKKDEAVIAFVEKWHKWVEAGSRPQKAKGKSKTKAKQKLSA